MRRIVYISTSTALLDGAAVENILLTSRRNNQRDGVGGLLVYHDGCFFQVLEGAAQAVQMVFDRLSGDSRHRGLLVLSDCQIDAPAFPEWAMALVHKRDLTDVLANASISLRDLIAAPEQFLTDKTSATLLRAFLKSFRDIA